MNDKEIMTNILNAVKGECDLLMHGTIESSTPGVHSAFKQSYDDAICMQNKIYAKMSEKGWYPMQQAQGPQIDAVKQKFANQ
jgi:spore coat protein CotF